MNNQKLHPVIRWAHRVSLGIFVLTTWGVAIFFIIDFWPLIRQLSLGQVLLAVVVFLLVVLVVGLLRMGRIVTMGQVVKFGLVMFFFIAMAVLYSYVGMKLGLFIRELFELEKMSAALA